MKQSRMSKIYNNKIFVIAMSLLISIALWAYISSQSSDMFRTELKGVQVQFVGEDTLKNDRGLAISNVSNTTVDVTVSGTWRNIGSLDASKVVAVIDVSNTTQPGRFTTSYSIRYPTGTSSSISVVARSPETISFIVSPLATKTVEVRGSFEGSLAEGFSAEEPTFEPSTITITGSESALANISYANVTFSKANVNSTFSVDTGFTLMDENGKQISNTGLNFSTEVIKATLPIKEIKEVPLAVTLIAGGGATADNCTVTIEPRTITLSGDSEVLAGINRLVVASINLNEVTGLLEDTFPINFDNELENLTGVTEANVKVEILGLETRQLSVSNISCTGLANGYTADIVTEVLTVTLRGPAQSLDALTPEQIRVVCDLSDYADTSGAVAAEARVHVDGVTDVGAFGSYRITVNIVKG